MIIPVTDAAEQVRDELAGDNAGDQAIVTSDTRGFVVVTQSCDLLRDCHVRPMAELAPLIEMTPAQVEEVRRLKRPNFAYVPAVAAQNLVADLERTMTIEKAVLAKLQRKPGVDTDRERADLARKRQRFAFPDSFNDALRPLQQRLDKQASKKNSEEGTHVNALIEIRAAAAPAWEGPKVSVTLWLIKGDDPQPNNWQHYAAAWGQLFNDPAGVYTLDGVPRVVRLEDMRASEYLASHHLDWDQLTKAA
jgi:hypothetical protein